jgi:hypothetical protein
VGICGKGNVAHRKGTIDMITRAPCPCDYCKHYCNAPFGHNEMLKHQGKILLYQINCHKSYQLTAPNAGEQHSSSTVRGLFCHTHLELMS